MDSGRLVRFVPVFDPDQSEKRELLVVSTVHAWLYQADRKKSIDYKANIRAHLGKFVKGEFIDNVDYMKHLGNDIWEFRVQLETIHKKYRKENTRIFGAFARQDVFICTNWRLRDDFGNGDDPLWDALISRSITEWNSLFPGRPRVISRPFSNCIFDNLYDNYNSL